MSSREWHELNRIVKAAAKVVDDNEKYFTSILAVRARKLAEANPTDQTVVGMSGFLNKRADSNITFITKKELKEVYSKLYTPDNKFGKFFEKELDISNKTPVHKMARDPNEGQDFTKTAFDNLADPILRKELKSVFDKNVPYQPYSDEMSKNAEKACAHELNCLGVFPKKIETVAGKENVLLCRAVYETPKGESHAIIPVEIKNNKALMPSMFLSTNGFVNISSQSIKDHIKCTAGKSFKVNLNGLLDTILITKNGVPKPLTELERIMLKTAGQKEAVSDITTNAILYQEIDKEASNVEMPKFEQPQEVQDFAKRLTSNAGIAEFVFGKDTVDKGRNLILFKLNNIGYKNCQASVSNTDDNTIYYSTSVDGVKGFIVPVKVSNKQIQEPKIALAAGKMFELSANGISNILASGPTDQKAVAYTSPLYGLKPTELVKNIKTAMSNGNYVDAEEALNVLKHSGDSKAFGLGYTFYVNGLKGINKESSSKSKCKAPVKNAHSKYEICSHTGLPIHKVYQDKYGDCHPMYRKDMEDTSEGASFLTSRIYFE